MDTSLSPSDFEIIVQQTIAGLPPQFREKLEGVVVLVQPVARNRREKRLLGLYEGVPVTEWGHDYNGKPPDTITLFKDNIEREAQSAEEIPHIIRETLLHEIAHHFGFDHDRIDGMEERWRSRRA